MIGHAGVVADQVREARPTQRGGRRLFSAAGAGAVPRRTEKRPGISDHPTIFAIGPADLRAAGVLLVDRGLLPSLSRQQETTIGQRAVWATVIEVNADEFEALMRRIATGWNTGDAQMAADCFAPDAVYVEPPDRQRYVGREALYELSGGDDPPAMSMTWHHLLFDAGRGIGAGEYTITIAGARTYHGVTMVQVRDGLVLRWREYQYRNDLDWADFVADSRFEPDRL